LCTRKVDEAVEAYGNSNKHTVPTIFTKVIHIRNYMKYQHEPCPYKSFMENEKFTAGCYSGCFIKPESAGGWIARSKAHCWEILAKEHPKVAKSMCEVQCVFLHNV